MESTNHDNHDAKIIDFSLPKLKNPEQSGFKMDQDTLQKLQPHFVSIILGKPNSGKSTYIQNILCSKDGYAGKHKFALILICSPNHYDLQQNINIPDGQCIDSIDLIWFDKWFDKVRIYQQQENHTKHLNVCIIFDDCLHDVKGNKSWQNHFAKYFKNRRHLIFNTTISIFVTTQKYKSVPTYIRNLATQFVIFNSSRDEINQVLCECTSYNPRKMIPRIYDIITNDNGHQFVQIRLDSHIPLNNRIKIGFEYDFFQYHIDQQTNTDIKQYYL